MSPPKPADLAPVSAPRLLLLRHGETQWNREHRLQGRQNSELTPRGRLHASAQGAILKDLVGTTQFQAVTSPLGRARQTAEIALAPLGLTPTIDPRVQEISAGTWEGKTYAEVTGHETASDLPTADLMRLFLNAPEGEGYTKLRARCHDFLTSLQGPTIVVTHWIALATLRGLLRGLSQEQVCQLDRQQGVVFEIKEGVEQCHHPAAIGTPAL